MSKRRINEDGSINIENYAPRSSEIRRDQIRKISEEEIGRGAQGCVYLAYTPTLGVCVLKEFFVPKDNLSSSSSQKEIEQAISKTEASLKSKSREIKYTCEVDNHPNILRFYGYAVDDRSTYGILTEYMPNGSLDRHLHDDYVMTPYNILNWSLQVARALSYCHEVHHIVHRDVKPANVLLSQDLYTAKLCDFGFARVVKEGEMTNLAGTLNYMAPEVMDKNSMCDYSYKADVWSYGMFLYAITHKMNPFVREQKNFIRFRERLENDERPEIKEDIREHNTLLCTIMEQCWLLDPIDRPNMIYIVDMLDAAFTGFQR